MIVSRTQQNIGENCKENLQIGKCINQAIGTIHFHDYRSEFAEDSSYISPNNRLKSNISKWEKAGTDQCILSLIDDSNKITFKGLSDSFHATKSWLYHERNANMFLKGYPSEAKTAPKN